MPHRPTDPDYHALHDLLEAERSALLAGNLEKLTEMLSSKEALMDIVNARPQHDLHALKQLDQKVRRNQLLLDGALEGIRSVARRMAALRQSKGALETYGADGQRQIIELDAASSVEKRA
jgi:flagellar biosynthesis/type III secretory pathway chaperone